MAKYRAKGPDGNTYQIEGPDGASESEVMAQLQAQFEASKTAPAAPAAPLPGQQRSALANTGYGLARGAKNIVDAGAQWLASGADKVGLTTGEGERVKAMNKAGREEFAADTKGSKIAPIAEIGGEVLTTWPIGGAVGMAAKGAGVAANAPRLAAAGDILMAQGAAGKLAQRMASGAVSGATVAPLVEQAHGHGPTWSGAGGAAVMGAAVPAVLAGAGRVIRGAIPKAAGSAKVAPVTQAEAAAVPAAADAAKVAGGVAPGAIERKAAFEAVGAEPLGPMLTRDAHDWTSMRELAKADTLTGRSMVEKFKLIDERLGGALERMKTADTPSPGAVGESVADAFGKIQASLKGEADKAYAAARAHPEAKIGVDLDPLRAFVRENAHAHGLAPAEYGAVKAFIKQNAEPLANGKIGSVPRDKVESLRQMLGESAASLDPQRARVARNLVAKLDDALHQGDVFKEARSAYQKYAATVKDQGIIEDILKMDGKVDRKVPFEKVWQKVVGGDVASLKQVKNTLMVHGQDQAWSSMKSQAIEHLLDKAKGGGNGQFQYAKFEAALKALGKDRLEVLFEPAERKMLEHIKIAAQAARQDVGYSAVNHSNTTSRLVNVLAKGSIVPGVGGFIAPAAAAAKAMQGVRQGAREQKLMAEMLAGNLYTKGQKAAHRYNTGSRAAIAKALGRVPASAAVPIADRQ